jgi:hypothetical protein
MQFTTVKKQSPTPRADASSKMRTHHDIKFTAAQKRSQTPSTDEGSDGSADTVDETTGCEKHAPNRTNCSKPIVQSSSKVGQTRDREAEVITEIRNQIRNPRDPDDPGYVWIADWNEKYLRSFGLLRNFIEKHPDEFVIKRKGGRGYRVAEAIRDGRPNSKR